MDRGRKYTYSQLSELAEQKGFSKLWGYQVGDLGLDAAQVYGKGWAKNDPMINVLPRAVKNAGGQWATPEGRVLDLDEVDTEGYYGYRINPTKTERFGQMVEAERFRIRNSPGYQAQQSHAAQQRRWRALGGSVASRQATRGTILTSPSGIPGMATYTGGVGGGTLLGGSDRLGG